MNTDHNAFLETILILMFRSGEGRLSEDEKSPTGIVSLCGRNINTLKKKERRRRLFRWKSTRIMTIKVR